MAALSPLRAPRIGPADVRIVFGILLLFIAVNALVGFFTEDGAALKYGADVETWYRPALGLLKLGAFVDPDDPAKLLTLRPPLYPAFLALLLWPTGGAVWSVVVAQLALLFATGWIARAIAERWLPGYGNLVLALVVFNPNAIGSAHLVQSDTLYAFVFTLLFWCTIRFAEQFSWRFAIGTGVMLGLSLLVRNTLQVLLPVWPIALLVLGALSRGLRCWKRALAMGLAAAAIAYVITVPWLLHNYRAGDGFALTTSAHKHWFLRIEMIALEHCRLRADFPQAGAVLQAERARWIGERPDFDRLSERDRHDYLVGKYLERLTTYSAANYLCALLPSWALMYGTPGVSNMSASFGLAEQSLLVLLRTHKFSEFFSQVSPGVLWLTAWGIAFVVFSRFLSVVGMVALLRRKAWLQAVIIANALIYFTFIHLFSGASRYRLPLEPLLFILAAYGIDELRVWYSRLDDLRNAARHQKNAA